MKRSRSQDDFHHDHEDWSEESLREDAVAAASVAYKAEVRITSLQSVVLAVAAADQAIDTEIYRQGMGKGITRLPSRPSPSPPSDPQ